MFKHAAGRMGAVTIALIVAFGASVSHAQQTGEIIFSARQFTPDNGPVVPTFDNNTGRLIDIGRDNPPGVVGLGTIGNAIMGSNTVMIAGGLPLIGFATDANVNSGGAFGSGGTAIYTTPFFVNMAFFITDVAVDGTASVSYNSADATFTNNTGGALMGTAGAVLGITGSFGGMANAIGGAALTGSINVNGAGDEAWDPIVMVGRADGAKSTQNAILNFFAGNTGFNAFGVSLINMGNPVMVPAGGTFQVKGVLTLFADPPFTIDSLNFPLTPLDGLPDPPTLGSGSAIPEPASASLLIVGLSALAFGRRKNKRNVA